MTVAIIQFPKQLRNETCEALASQTIKHELISWNTTVDLNRYSGFILPGGFSFQDRIRADVIAAKLPVMRELKQQSNS